MSDDLDTQQGITATIKYAGGFDAPWMVTRGSASDVKRQLIEAFGLEGVEGLTLSEVLLLANQTAQASYAASVGLGAKPVAEDKPVAKKAVSKPRKAAEKASEPVTITQTVHNPKVSGQPTPEQEAAVVNTNSDHPHADLLAEIAALPYDPAARQKLWQDNRNAFKDPDVVAAMNERWKKLKEDAA